ncbi:MAG: hypothetical protein II561_06215 [Thermoguttaceae bacterium]|nr:hypothetical protein [Thermoguttaceae bacterium]
MKKIFAILRKEYWEKRLAALIARPRLIRRRVIVAAVFPVAVASLFVAVAFGWKLAKLDETPLETYALPKKIELEANEKPDEYLKRVEETRSEINREIASPVSTRFDAVDRTALEDFNRAALRFLRECEATNRLAAAPNAAVEAEANVYRTLAKLVKTPCASKAVFGELVDFLDGIPGRRPTPDRIAQNAYVSLQCGPLSFVENTDERNRLLECRKRSPEDWRAAIWNLCQRTPNWIQGRYDLLDGVPQTRVLSLPKGRAEADAVTEKLRDYTVNMREAENEVARRALLAAAVAKGADGPDRDWPVSFSYVLIDDKRVETPKGIARYEGAPILPAKIKPAQDASDVTSDLLKPFLGDDGEPVLIDGKETWYVWNAMGSPTVVMFTFPRVAAPAPKSEGGDSEPAPNFTTGNVSVFATALFDKTGRRLTDKDGALYYGLWRHRVEEGRPIILVDDFGDDEPPFPHDPETVLTRLRPVPASPSGKTFYSRVRAVDPFGPPDKKTTALEHVWKKTVFPPADSDAGQNDPSEETADGGRRPAKPTVTYVGDDGNEILENSEPKYRARVGAFANTDLPPYKYEFPLYQKRGAKEKFEILQFRDVGDYAPLPESEYEVKNNKVHTRAMGILFVIPDRKALTRFDPNALMLECKTGAAKSAALFVPLDDER